MGKGWSYFFGAVLFGTFIIWPASVMFGWWLPENVASFGGGVDLLFYMILGFSTFFFVLTEVKASNNDPSSRSIAHTIVLQSSQYPKDRSITTIRKEVQRNMGAERTLPSSAD